MGTKQMAELKKTEIFKIANSQKNFGKISWIGPERIKGSGLE
jgi:hypothetical protein